jgi:hypothetical protein
MRTLIEHCCGRLHASTIAEWFRHDPGSLQSNGKRADAGDEVIHAMGGSLE